jgi:N-acetylneuraminic acid mutarotase
MMTRRLGVAVAVLNGYLYAIGGSDGQCPLNTVERYDPQKNCWTVMASMSTRRKHLGCAVYNNMIYAGKSSYSTFLFHSCKLFLLKDRLNAGSLRGKIS